LEDKLGSGPFSEAFKKVNAFTFKMACTWVQSLPYKRNSTKDNPFIVLQESCGTCSSKHELIKRLADENQIEGCELILCMFKMSADNTPKVKPILQKYGLDYIPEAHTFIRLDGDIVDLTFPDKPELLYLDDIIYEEKIEADQIRAYKAETHRSFMEKWGKENGLEYDFEELWKIREECIEILSN